MILKLLLSFNSIDDELFDIFSARINNVDNVNSQTTTLQMSNFTATIVDEFAADILMIR